MKRFLLSRFFLWTVISLCAAAIQSHAAAPLTFGGNRAEVISVTPDRNSGLDALYVVDGTDGLTVTYTASSAQAAAAAEWSRYSSLGGAYAEPVDPSALQRDGNRLTLRAVEPDMGYMITDGTTRCYFWIADYSRHPFMPRSLEADPEADCTATTLVFEGEASRMVYYSINGRTLEIDREITVSWNSMSWNEEEQRFTTVEMTDTRAWLPERFSVSAPLCPTSFTAEGDRFLRQWGSPLAVTTATIYPTAIDAHTDAIQTERDNANEQRIDGVELGGSAPCEIRFTAEVTDAAIFTEWQMARDPEFDLIDFRSNDLTLDYTFREMGMTYVRFVAANADATCDYTSDTYTVSVGESALVCPNAFSPGASEGVNDEWKVSYRSIISFECHIFNKWGVKMAEFTDPSQGWDGKYNGKLVPAGVYYYVIKAEGADGKKYDRAGDINIVGYR